ncbi:MAG: flagellar biosynthesis anti-sigma factor FlgM [Bacteroidales bacterium]|nr:flagellar biosynthesis anti-sigma factor FlgM [Bacteroidales bacterium]MCM1415879.1 flagellar biosynthesis anti-sigma factor FlgM [bacterium]MCM1422691.1 flagellar biosynthesis anti-sigma factor FlgM [bacterium]
MRIEAYTQVQQVYGAKSRAKTQNTAKSAGSDRIHISSIGKDIQTAKNAVAAAEDVRSELVAPIKAGIANGTYQVSGEKFAEKLLKQYEEIESL